MLLNDIKEHYQDIIAYAILRINNIDHVSFVDKGYNFYHSFAIQWQMLFFLIKYLFVSFLSVPNKLINFLFILICFSC